MYSTRKKYKLLATDGDIPLLLQFGPVARVLACAVLVAAPFLVQHGRQAVQGRSIFPAKPSNPKP